MTSNPDILSTPLTTCKELPTTCVNRLERERIITIGDITKMDRRRLRFLPGIGDKSRMAIEALLKKHNLKLQGE